MNIIKLERDHISQNRLQANSATNGKQLSQKKEKRYGHLFVDTWPSNLSLWKSHSKTIVIFMVLASTFVAITASIKIGHKKIQLTGCVRIHVICAQ